jgi:hypothetical protein
MDRKEQFRFLIDYWTLIEKAQQQPALSGERRATMKLAMSA